LKITRLIITANAVWKGFRNGNGFLWTTTLTYTTLFALVPLFAIALSLFKLWGGFSIIQQSLLPIISDFLDPSQKIQVMKYIQSYVDNIKAGTLGTIGTVIFILASIPLFLGVDDAINSLWGKTDTRPVWLKFAICWSLTTLGPIAILVILSILSLLDSAFPELSIILKSVKVIMLIFIIFILFMIYKIVPNTRVKNRPAFIGSFISGILWIFSYNLYQVYMRHVTYSFNIYGSLGAIPVFLLWIYINWLILLLGVQITKQIQYPNITGDMSLITPTDRFCAAVDIFKYIFLGMTNGVYYDESKLINILPFPPEVSSSTLSMLNSSGLLQTNGKILLPTKSMNEIMVVDMLHIFMGHIENEIIGKYSLDIAIINQYSLKDLK
jgi:membrane protein